MFCALCWTIWKLRNEYCFQHGPKKTFRTIILLIISLITYWTGIVKRQLRELVQADWLPQELDAIPLQVWDPDAECGTDLAMVIYQPPDDDDEAPPSCVA